LAGKNGALRFYTHTLQQKTFEAEYVSLLQWARPLDWSAHVLLPWLHLHQRLIETSSPILEIPNKNASGASEGSVKMEEGSAVGG
jgi:hypothetical protein